MNCNYTRRRARDKTREQRKQRNRHDGSPNAELIGDALPKRRIRRTLPFSQTNPREWSSLPVEDPINKGRDQKTIWGFFNRAGIEYWCSNLKAQLAALRGSDDPGKRAACAYLADRAYQGTDLRYEGGPKEVRTIDGKSKSLPVNSICSYYGLNSKDYDEDIPVHLHPGYVGWAGSSSYRPNERGSQNLSSQSVESWCRMVPVVDLMNDPATGKLSSEDIVADPLPNETGYEEVILTAHNLGSETGRLSVIPTVAFLDRSGR